MFGKNKLQKILALMADLTDEELGALSQRTDELKGDAEAESTASVGKNGAEKAAPKAEGNANKPDKLGEALAAIEAIKDTVEALAARMDAYDQSKEAAKDNFEFGLAGANEASEDKRDSLEKIKEKYWNL